MLVKICVCGVDSTLKLKGKITVANNDLRFADFLKKTKLDDGPYMEVLVSSGSYSESSNFDLKYLEQVNVSELKEYFKD